jgi:expansin (peptidoglycan-binding protein)
MALAAVVAACSSSGTGSTGTPSVTPGSGSTPAVVLKQPESGVATFYAADGSGNCGFDPSPNDLNVAAMNAAEYDGSAVCGECVAITGPKGQITVRIVDQCADCYDTGHLDLSQQAFAQIADPSAGRVPITWDVVACDVSGNLAYHFKDASSQWWTAIQVRNSRLPIARLEWMQGGAWVNVQRADYNYFIVDSGVGNAPFQVRVTAIDGQQLVDTLPAPQSDVTVPGAGQFH